MPKLKAPLSAEYLGQPYRSEDEPLSRLNLANQLTSLFKNLDHGSVSILNGRWGSGKSTFAKKLVHHLKSEQISVTYFDAFSKDYSESPFLALSSHILNEIEKHSNQTLPSAIEIRKTSGKVARNLGSVSAKIIVKAATLGLIGGSEIDQLSNLADEIADASGDLAEQASTAVFDEFLQAESDFEKFRSSLDGLATALDPDPEGQNGKTVFIIDELDRCRPDFALATLEVIKHLFDNDNIHFVFVTNIDYLVASVDATYGLGTSSSEYLEKFYDFVIFFEERSWDTHRHAAASLIEQRLSLLLEGHQGRDVHDLSESLQAFARGFDLSLRQASSLVTNASLAFLAYNDRSFRSSMLISILVLYRTKFPEVYQDIKKGNFTTKQLTSVFDGIQFGDSFHDERLISIIEFYSAHDGEIDRNDARYQGYAGMTARYNFRSYRDVLVIMANSVIDNFGGG